MDTLVNSRINYFSSADLEHHTLPERFTFPFFYEPHPLAVKAASALQEYITSSVEGHNFGLTHDMEGGQPIGKMFGVLVVKDTLGRVGHLWAFSGKLANSNDHDRFVPPVFDMLEENSFFLKEQYILNSINDKVKQIETDDAYLALKQELLQLETDAAAEIEVFKQYVKQNKSERKQQRTAQKAVLSPADYAEFEALMIKHSLHDKHRFNVLIQTWDARIALLKEKLDLYSNEIERLKKERKEKSAALQQQLFEQYAFLNQYGLNKSLHDIFSNTVFGKPPAAAGECATPKLLQYAFQHGFTPLAMAEFWWGAPPKSEVRKHGQYYPACTGKCKPILEHMLEGITTDENPFLLNPGEGKQLDVVYEDDHFIVVNKPHELLSVPGIAVSDSVYTRLKYAFKTIEPLIIHRLDMATSGLLVVAKTKAAHKDIQKQFLKRTVTKRYAALLQGNVPEDEGDINLPLRGDIDNRPYQLVCFEFGKRAHTTYKVIARNADGTVKVHFWPHTGRTHQLRMHAAHKLGLNAPIKGDDLYGSASDRLYLHAAYLKFIHPETGKEVVFEAAEPF
ncbi:pseudouridine synthase [Flavobacterium sp. RNTU_13]|uniref:RluA family pseudouridine synthase n=1 Tax=Flavobacterium sp. RNTU_13 TaxID=3375145 RepID=UPI003986A93B